MGEVEVLRWAVERAVEELFNRGCCPKDRGDWPPADKKWCEQEDGSACCECIEAWLKREEPTKEGTP